MKITLYKKTVYVYLKKHFVKRHLCNDLLNLLVSNLGF